MKFLSILFIVAIAVGCNSETKIRNFYQTHNADMTSMRNLADTLIREYDFTSAVLRTHPRDIGIRLSIRGKNSFDGTGDYYDHQTLTPINHSTKDIDICDSCTSEQRENYRLLLQDTKLKSLLQLYTTIKPKAIEISKDGIFFALGSPLNSTNIDMEGGIFMSFYKEMKKGTEIDKNVIITDTQIE